MISKKKGCVIQKMRKNNEKIKAEIENDIRKTAKQDKIKFQIRKRKITKAVITIMAIILIGLLINIIVMSRKIKIRDEDVAIYNYFLIEKEEKNGIIDKDGNVLINPEYDYIQIPNPEKPVFICFYDYNEETGEYSSKVVNEIGDQIYTDYNNINAIPRNNTSKKYLYQNNILTYKENDKYGIISIDGKKITNAEYDSIETLEYKDGVLIVKKDENVGLIKLNGEIIIKPKYYSIISDGFFDDENNYENAGYIVGTKTDSGYKYGYINTKGKEVLKCEYNIINRILEIEDEDGAYLITSKSGKIGLNRNAQVKIENEYELIEYDDINKILEVKKNGKYGVYDLDGNMILPTQYEELQSAGKIITAQKDGELLVFDANGSLKKDFKYVSVIPTKSENYFITINSNAKYGLVDNNNDVLIDSKYDYIEYAFDNYFIFSDDGKSGIIDSTGNIIVKNAFDIVQAISGTNVIQAIDSSNNKSYILNKNIRKVAEITAPHIYLKNDYIKLVSNDNLIYLDFDGNIKEASDILQGNTIFAKEQNGKWGYVSAAGNVVIDYQYELTQDINQYGYGAIKQNGKWGVVNSKGEFILDPIYEIDDIEPIFIGEYYKKTSNYEVSVFTK